jgi:hypothetical protein
MAKKGQHKNDDINPSKPKGHEKSRGHNNPDKSVTITTGSYKKPETYKKQAYEHKDPYRQAQAARADRNEDIRDKPTIEGSTRARDSSIRSGRSGSDSNADAGTRGH